jgi:hypothetical protein
VPTANPAGFAVILRFVGVVPLFELTSSQFDPTLVFATTENGIAVPSVLVTARFWNEEPLDPIVSVKVAALGLSTNSAVLLTTSVTGIVCGVLVAPPLGVIEIVPV